MLKLALRFRVRKRGSDKEHSDYSIGVNFYDPLGRPLKNYTFQNVVRVPKSSGGSNCDFIF